MHSSILSASAGKQSVRGGEGVDKDSSPDETSLEARRWRHSSESLPPSSVGRRPCGQALLRPDRQVSRSTYERMRRRDEGKKSVNTAGCLTEPKREDECRRYGTKGTGGIPRQEGGR
eukprot:384789-Hanusia_phi.AAC.2